VDTDAAIPVVYRGALPALFRAGQGVVAEGHWHPQTGVFKATKLLVKHDENYRPPKPGEKAPVASVIE
jgi:cytochrome c-type biogenesis protein CcmE